MKKLLLVPLVMSLFSVPVQSQQVNEYQTCIKYREVYTPGYYDNYGRYIQGGVVTQEYRANCQTGAAISPSVAVVQQPYAAPAPYAAPRPYYNGYGYPGYYRGGVYCNPTRTSLGALLGGGIAASMSRGNGYYWSVPVGAAIGGALFGCNRY
jgi:hypothetical protein